MARDWEQAFAVWLTGRPASGKSTIAAVLRDTLEAAGIRPAVLESDVIRRGFAPQLGYSPEDRDLFYRQLVYLGTLLTRHGVPVIFDATANRRAYRESARNQIANFLEVYVDTPLATCAARDPKGIYRSAAQGGAGTVPGVQEAYEAPENPDVLVHGDRESPQNAARRIVSALAERGYIEATNLAH